jgi:hypothetical protein
MKDDMPGIVERLRADTRSAVSISLSEEAADEIERLRELIRLNGLIRGMTEAEIAVLTGRLEEK